MNDNYGDLRPMFGEPITDWYRWFAWRPVNTVDRGWRWLRPLWKRRIAKHEYLDGGADFWFQHAVTLPRVAVLKPNAEGGPDA